MFIRSFLSCCALICLTILALSGCDSSSPTESESDSSASVFTLPRAITQSRLADSGIIKAYIQVDGGARQAMAVGKSSVSILLSGLSTDVHQFTIILEYTPDADPQTPITLVESSKSVNVSSGSNSLSFSESDFDFSQYDHDEDGISNLDEMLSGGSAPVVRSVFPSDRTTGVQENTSITATFDDPMIASTLTTSSFMVIGASSGLVSGTVSYDRATKTATFKPASVLNYTEAYTATLSTTVQNSASIGLASVKSWSFTVKSTPVVPVVDIAFSLPQTLLQSSLSDTGATTAYLQVDEGTRKAMTLTGSTASIQLSGLAPGMHQFSVILEYALTSDPQTPVTLVESTKNASISAGGNSISFADSDFDFSLLDSDNDSISNFDEMLSGGSAPVVSSVSPLEGASGVLENTNITAVFDDPMISSTITTSSFTVTGASSGAVSGAVSYDSATKTATFTPASVLNYAEVYTVTLSTTVQNSASIGLASAKSWSFTVKSASVTQVGSVSTLSTSSSPILAYNDAGDGVAVWIVQDVGYSLKYSMYDRSSDTWSSEALLSSSAFSNLMEPQLVSNGAGFALVWEESDDVEHQLYGSFYDGSNWSTPVIIDTEVEAVNSPVLASNGTGYAVTWYQNIVGDSRIFASVSTDATSWGAPVVIDNGLLNARYPKIVSNGSEYAVVWQEALPERIGVNIYHEGWGVGTAILLDDETSTYGSYGYDIASNGSGFSVVWGNNNSVYNRTYYNSGTFGWSPIIEINGSISPAYLGGASDGPVFSIASNGTGYATIFSGLANSIKYAVINTAGDSSWGTPAALQLESNFHEPGNPMIVSNGNTYAALWPQYTDASTFDLFSSVYDGTSWPIAAAIDTGVRSIKGGYSLVGSGSQYIATWAKQFGNSTKVYAKVYTETSPQNEWGQVQALDTGSQNVTPPTIKARPNGGATVSWSQLDLGVFANTFNSSNWSGERLLASAPGGSSLSSRLFSNGHGQTLAVWKQKSSNNYDLYVNISKNGIWGQPQLLFSGSDQIEFYVTTDGIGFAMVWNDYDGAYWSIYASIFDGIQWGAVTEVDDSSIAGHAYTGGRFSPIVSNGNGYMLVYSQYDGSNYYDTYARQYKGSGWKAPVVLNSHRNSSNVSVTPSIATNGMTYLAVWVLRPGISLPSTEAYSSEFDGTSWSDAERFINGGSSNDISASIIGLVSNGADYLAVWAQDDGTSQYRALSNFYAAGSWGTASTLDTGTTGHQLTTPSVISNGTGYAVVWDEHTGTADSVVVNIYNGTSWLGPVTLDDGASGSVHLSYFPRDFISSYADSYAVTWSRDDGTGVLNPFVSVFDGTWSPATALETNAATIDYLQIASNGNGFLASWIQQDDSDIHHVMQNRYDPVNGWSGSTILDTDLNNRVFDLSLIASPDVYQAIWTQAEPSGDPIVRFPWARMGF